MNDFRKNKTWLQKKAINLALWILRKAGTPPPKFETKDAVRSRRKSYLPELEEAGYVVEKKTDYQFRINGLLDVYPTNARFHCLKTGARGEFGGQNLATFVRKYLKEI